MLGSVKPGTAAANAASSNQLEAHLSPGGRGLTQSSLPQSQRSAFSISEGDPTSESNINTTSTSSMLGGGGGGATIVAPRAPIHKLIFYLIFLPFFCANVLAEFAFVHLHMEFPSETFVFYILFFYFLGEFAMNLLIAMFTYCACCKDSYPSASSASARRCNPMAVFGLKGKTHVTLVFVNGFFYVGSLAFRMFSFLFASANVFALFYPLLYPLGMMISRFFEPKVFDVSWVRNTTQINPDQGFRRRTLYLPLLLYVLSLGVFLSKNENIFNKNLALVTLLLWLLCEFGHYVCTQLLKSAVGNVNNMGCRCCGRHSVESGSSNNNNAVPLVSANDNLSYLTISFYRALIGMAVSFMGIMVFEVDQYEELFTHVDIVEIGAVLTLNYVVTHMFMVLYRDRSGDNNPFMIDWICRAMMLEVAAFLVFTSPAGITQGISLFGIVLSLALYIFMARRESK